MSGSRGQRSEQGHLRLVVFRIKASVWMFDVVGLGELQVSEPQTGFLIV